MFDQPIPYGFCHCGCGRQTTIAKQSLTKYGHVKGEPKRFIRGHGYVGPHRSGPDYVVDPETGCWVWQHCIVDGYGRLRHDGDTRAAHRVYYERFKGSIPEGLQLDHLCRNPPCVNPDHLEAVPHAINGRRGSQAKLTQEDADAIRRSSARHVDLANVYDVHPTTILRVRQGVSWWPV